jgi:hypothetical protein
MDVPSVGTAAYAEEYAIAHYGNSPAVIFIIDMYDRQLYIYTNGSALKTITRADSRAITDNIYKIASKGNYYECADQAFSQILGKCRGERLARPVKHITNALIAVLCGILLNYCFTVYSRIPSVDRRTTGNVNVSVSRQMANMPGISLALPIVLSSVKRYKSRSSGGGGHGGGETQSEVRFLGVDQVETEDGQTMNVGHMEVDHEHVALVDVDNNMVFDVAVSDLNQNQQIDADEVVDISDQQISVTDFAVMAEVQNGGMQDDGAQMAMVNNEQDHIADDMPDYMNDVDVQPA